MPPDFERSAIKLQRGDEDIARHLDARIINEGELATRRVKKFTLLARTVPNMMVSLKPGYILVTPADRADVFVAVAMAVNQPSIRSRNWVGHNARA